MSTYDEVKAEIGDGPKYPSRSDYKTVYGYRGGLCLGKFPDVGEALHLGAATTEVVFDQKNYDIDRIAYVAHNDKITNTWLERIKSENEDINEKVFNLVYGAAYERGHSYGFSEVEMNLEEGLDLARKIIAAANET